MLHVASRFLGGQARPLAGDTREHRELHSTFSRFGFSSFQCRACAVDVRRFCSTYRCVAHQISTYCSAGSFLCRFSERLATKVHGSVRQYPRSHRRAHRTELLQWRSMVRRMVRCKLPGDTCTVHLSGGAFVLFKDEARDRLICDRRPQNSQESAVSRVLLPFCPRLRCLILQRSEALGVHIVDTRNCFYLYQVDSPRWHTQVIGPRTPASWLHHIDDDTCDDICDDNLETWWEADLRHSSDIDEPQRSLLPGSGSQAPAYERWSAPYRLPAVTSQSNEFGDVYIDDLVLFSILLF